MDGTNVINRHSFPVELVPLAGIQQGTNEQGIRRTYPVAESMARAVVRTDTGQALGVHGGAYKLVKHDDVCNQVQDAVDQSDISNDYTHDIQVYESGAKLKGTIMFNDLVVEPQVGDHIKYAIDYYNSYDGAWSIMLRCQGYRLWCSNGCSSPNPLTYTRSKHTTGFQLTATVSKIKTATEIFFNEKDSWIEYAQTKVSKEDVARFIRKQLCPRGDSRSVKQEYNWTRFHTIESICNNEYRQLGQNKWAVYNALTYWASHTEETNNPHRAQVLRHNEVTRAISGYNWSELGT